MTLAYTRAYLDRNSASDTGPLRFVAATEGRKGDSIDLRMSGARLDRYRANPVVLYGHRYYSREDLPIGRGTNVAVEGDRLMIDVVFDAADEFAQTVERKYRSGFLNAVSIGFDVIAWEGDQGSYWTGGVAEQWELLELSAVPVPMDAHAVVQTGRGLARLLAGDVPIEVTTDEGSDHLTVRVGRDTLATADPLELAAAILRGLHAPIPTPAPLPTSALEPAPTSPPAPTGVDTRAAKDLLAALTLPEEANR
jgi:hypothetical protein